MTMLRALLRVLVPAIVLTAPVAAQQTHVIIITGLGGEPQYSAAFHKAALELHETARTKWSVADASLFFLAEDTSLERVGARSTRDEIERAFTALQQRVAAGDLLLVFLLGHGSGEGPQSAVSLPGPDPTAAQFKAWLAPFTRQTIVFVNASSASGDFVPVISSPGRIVVTATKSAMERNESVFATHFVKGLTTGEADADKDTRISVREAFEYAKREVARSYESANKLMTEHAVLSDSTLAQTVAFGGEAASNDPRVAALVAQRRALEDELTALRSRKAQMDSTAYSRELERLLTAIAVKTEAIRAARGGGR
jgi:hypothetical protein